MNIALTKDEAREARNELQAAIAGLDDVIADSGTYGALSAEEREVLTERRATMARVVAKLESALSAPVWRGYKR